MAEKKDLAARLAAFQGAKERFIAKIAESDPDKAEKLKQLSDEQVALYLHATTPQYRSIPIVDFLDNAGFRVPDIMNEYYRPGAPDETDWSQYLGSAMNDPDNADRNQRLMELKYSTGPSPYSVNPIEGSLRSIASVGTFENADEIIARMRQWAASVGGNAQGMSDDELYQLFLKDEREKAKQFAFEHPRLDAAARFVGGLSGASLLPTGAGMSIPGRVAVGIGSGGTAAFLQGMGSSEGDLEEKLLSGAVDVLPGTAFGALFAPIGRYANPTEIVPEAQAASKTLKGFGVKSLTAGQKTGDVDLLATEAAAKKPFNAALEKQRQQYTEALWREAGIGYPKLDKNGRPVLDLAGKLVMEYPRDTKQSTLTKVVNDLAAEADAVEGKYTVDLPPITTDINDIFNKYLTDPDLGRNNPAIRDAVDIINDVATNRSGQLTGTEFRKLHSSLMAAAARTVNAKDGSALRALANTLDGAMETSIAKLNPDDAKAFSDIRRKWSGLYTVADAVARDAEATRTGFIKPEVLRDAVVARDDQALLPRVNPKDPKRLTPEQVENPFIKLANAAEEVGLGSRPAKSDPNLLKTLSRHAVVPGLSTYYGAGIGTLLGGPGVGTMLGASIGAAAGAGTEAGISAAKSKTVMSPLVQKYLGSTGYRWADPIVSDYLMSLVPGKAENFTETLGLKDAMQPYDPSLGPRR